MGNQARERIDTHRLMQTSDAPDHEVRIREARNAVDARKLEERVRWMRRAKVHVLAFLMAFVFTVGISVLGVLLWVRPESLISLVFVGIFSSLVFVAAFAAVRMLILHRIIDDYPNKEDDPGMQHHFVKSVAYGFVALVVAIVLAGLIINIASADIL